jgi:ammonium transporter, Amt family
MIERVTRGHASILGFCSGAVAGLVVITPATGFVDATGAIVIGIFAALVPYFFVTKAKGWFGYDDALDTFGVHAVGGTLGAFLTGILATGAVNANLTDGNLAAKKNGLAGLVAHGGLYVEQLKAIGLTLVLSIVGTIVLGYLVKACVGLRPSSEVETQGLDINEHGEEGYVL